MTDTPENKIKEFYQKNPNVIMYFSSENGGIVFDYDDTKIDAYDAILLAHNTVNEFLKSITERMRNQQVQTVNKKEEK